MGLRPGAPGQCSSCSLTGQAGWGLLLSAPAHLSPSHADKMLAPGAVRPRPTCKAGYPASLLAAGWRPRATLTMRLLNSFVTRKAMSQLVRTQAPVATPLTCRGKISDMSSQGMGPQPNAKPVEQDKSGPADADLWAAGLAAEPLHQWPRSLDSRSHPSASSC